MNSSAQRQTLAEIISTSAGVPLEKIVACAGKGERYLAHDLRKKGVVDPEVIARSLAVFLSLPYLPPGSLHVHASAQHWLSGLEKEAVAIPLRMDDGVLHAAVADPFDLDLTEQLQLLARKVRLAVASPESIKQAFEQSLTSSIRLRTNAGRIDFVTEENRAEAVAAVSETAPAVKLINQLLSAAIDENASDVHIEFRRTGTSIRFRIDGVLREMASPADARLHDVLILRLKVMAELDIAEKRIPQDGRFSFVAKGRKVDCRLSILPGQEMENAVIRILDRNFHADVSLNLEQLGFDETFVAAIRRAVSDPYGMVVVTGPTGSGKTTTLYAALSEVDAVREKIISIEDPIEYRVDGVTQIAVNEKKQLTFARGLRSILRHDPDKIMVGEIRDGETANIAVQSALTGHLVLTTIHANSSLEVISRFTHLGVDLYDLATGLNYVAAQRLVRLICIHCITPLDPGSETLATIRQQFDEQQVWFDGAGCEHCQGTGYKGRVAIGEVLKISPEMRRMIVERRLPEDLAAVAQRNGFSSMREKAVVLAREGRTSLREVNRVTLVG
jgi:type II secretory ATPase GspE/PulE/Tfp pilus assembly ATPase PilB-like protein